MKDADIIIIGSGMGGATMAAALAHTGQKIVILERGEQIAASDWTRNPQAIFGEGIYRSDEQWLDENDRPFNPGNYYYVGGNSKFYGAVLIRYRACDFDPIQHLDGQTPGWPISYADLEPFYQKAEHLYQVRGETGDDPTEPPHSGSYDFPPVPDEADIADLRRRLAQVLSACRWVWISTNGWLAARPHGMLFLTLMAAKWMRRALAYKKHCPIKMFIWKQGAMSHV